MAARSSRDSWPERYSHLLPIIFGLIMTFMAAMIIGISFEIFPSQQISRWPAKVTAAIFGTLLLGAGWLSLRKGLRLTMNKAGLRRGPLPRRLLAFYRRRITWRSALAGFSYLLLAGQFLHYWQTGQPWPPGSGEELKALFYVEFALLHSTLFMGLFAIVPLAGHARLIKYGVILLFTIFYTWVMATRLSVYGLLSFLFLIVAKYGGYYLRPPDSDRKFSLFCRWGVHFLTFILISAATGNSRLTGFPNIISSFWYFLCLGIYEILDLFSVRTSGSMRKDSATVT